MEKLRVGAKVMARHPFSDEMEEGVVMRIRTKDEYSERGPFYLVRFKALDDWTGASRHCRIIRRWVMTKELESIE